MNTSGAPSIRMIMNPFHSNSFNFVPQCESIGAGVCAIAEIRIAREKRNPWLAREKRNPWYQCEKVIFLWTFERDLEEVRRRAKRITERWDRWLARKTAYRTAYEIIQARHTQHNTHEHCVPTTGNKWAKSSNLLGTEYRQRAGCRTFDAFPPNEQERMKACPSLFPLLFFRFVYVCMVEIHICVRIHKDIHRCVCSETAFKERVCEWKMGSTRMNGTWDLTSIGNQNRAISFRNICRRTTGYVEELLITKKAWPCQYSVRSEKKEFNGREGWGPKFRIQNFSFEICIFDRLMCRIEAV